MCRICGGQFIFGGQFKGRLTTEGKWHFTTADDHWEYCHIVEGVSEITEDGGKPQRFVAGQSFILHPGFSGVWHAIEATKKEFVIVNPQSNGK